MMVIPGGGALARDRLGQLQSTSQLSVSSPGSMRSIGRTLLRNCSSTRCVSQPLLLPHQQQHRVGAGVTSRQSALAALPTSTSSSSRSVACSAAAAAPTTPPAAAEPASGGADSNAQPSTAYPFPEIEAKWQAHWEQQQTFRTPEEVDTSKPKYYVLDMFPYPR